MISFGISVFLLFILSVIRWDTGTDWDSYFDIYKWIEIPWENMNNGMEFAFNMVNHLGKFIFDSYTGVLLLFAIIIYICIFKSYTFFSQYPITTLFLSFSISFASMLFVRQNVALSILLISLICVHEKKIYYFLLLVFIASLFHRTAWIFLLVYPIYHKYYKSSFLFILLFVTVFISLALSEFLFSFVGNLGLGVISKKIEMYLEAGAEDNTMTFSTTTVLIKGLMNRILLLGVYFFYLNDVRKTNVMINGLLNIYILGTVLYCATLPLSISLARIAVYMDIVQIFVISYIIYDQNKLLNRICLFCLFSLYFCLRFYTFIISYRDEYIPFETIFS